MIELSKIAEPKNSDMSHLEPLCRDYDIQCVNLELMVAELERDLEKVKQTHLRKLKVQAGVVARREAELHNALEACPDLFKSPRTVVMHGTKVGYVTSTGSVAWEDESRVIKMVRKHFSDRFDELVKTEETPRKNALKGLTPAELATLGCRIDGAGDNIVISRVAGDMEKLINKLIGKMVEAIVAGD